MLKKILILCPLVMMLSACATGGDGVASTPAGGQSTTQQLGVSALKMAVNAKCVNELNNLTIWKTASQAMTSEQQQNVQTKVCGCVSDKAPESVTAVDLANAAFNTQARTQIAAKAIDKTITTCLAEVSK